MTPPLAITRAEGPVHRVARQPDAWAWPEWPYAHEDGTFGNRFDDPRAASGEASSSTVDSSLDPAEVTADVRAGVTSGGRWGVSS